MLVAKGFCDENGYVIIRNIYSEKVCDTLRNFGKMKLSLLKEKFTDKLHPI